MALGSRIGSLYVRVGADTRQFHREMQRVNSPLERFRRVAGTAVKAFAAVGAAATAASGGIYALARSEMNLIDEQAKLARSIGGTVTGLRTLKLAAEDNGIDGLEGSLNRLNRRLGAVEMGGGPAAETVKRLGLNLKELSEMDIDDRLAAIADTIHESGMSAQEAARHLQQLGFQQQEATTFFMQGGDAIRAARDEIEAFGLSVSMLDAARMEEANTQLSRMSLVVQGLRTQLAVALAPAMLQTAQTIANVARELMTMRDRTGDAHDALDELQRSTFVTDFLHPVIVGFARLIDVLIKVGQAVKAVGHSFRVVSADIATFTSRTAIGQIDQLEQLEQQFGEFDTPQIGEQLIEGLQIDRSRADEALAQHRAVLAERDQILKEANAAWDRFLNEAGNKYEQAALRGLATPLPEITVPGTRPDGDGASGLSASTAELDEKELERRREMLEQRLQMLREFVADEMELEIFQHEQKLEQLRELWEEGIIPTEEEFMELREQLEEDHQDRLAALVEKGERDRADSVKRWADYEMQMRASVVQNAVSLLDQMAGKSKAAAIAAIALSKGMMIAQTLQSTYAAQMRAMAELGPIAGPPAAAKIGVMGKINAALIAATGLMQAASVSSRGTGDLRGGASGSIGGRSSAPSSTVPAAPDAHREHSVVTINLVGEVFNRQQVRELIEHINEATKDGAVLRLN